MKDYIDQMLRRVDLDTSTMGGTKSTPQAPGREFRASTMPRMPMPSDPAELDRRFNKVLVCTIFIYSVIQKYHVMYLIK